MDVLDRVVFEAICAPPSDARMTRSCRRFCPISDHQFQVAAAEQISIESLLEQVKPLWEDKIVMGFSLVGDLQMLGITLPAERKRELQVHFKLTHSGVLAGKGLT